MSEPRYADDCIFLHHHLHAVARVFIHASSSRLYNFPRISAATLLSTIQFQKTA